MKWCPKNCDNYLYHDVTDGELYRKCLKCGYNEKDPEGGLVVESRIKGTAAEGYKILLNEFTHLDPTLPHVKNIKCPNEVCPSNTSGVERDVIYMKHDSANLKFLYICTVCPQRTSWRSQ